ncbi:MAG: hypothetical protein AAB420_02810 [Patescibacteria group bacterium]
MTKKFTIILLLIIAAIIGFAIFRTPSESPVRNDSRSDSGREGDSDFTVTYPAGYKVSSAASGVTTVENEEGRGFQIAVTAFDEPGPITEERIRQDLPDAEINEPAWYELDGEKTFVFYGFDEDLGETFEVWTVHGGKLYQIMGTKTDEEVITKTLKTWKWK